MADTESVSDSNSSISSENEGDLGSHLDENIKNFAIDFLNIIKILENMIIEARNKNPDNIVTQQSNNGNNSDTSSNSTPPFTGIPSVPPVNSDDGLPSVPPVNFDGSLPSVPPVNSDGGPPTAVPVIPSTPVNVGVNSNNNVTPAIEPNADDNEETNLQPSPEPSNDGLPTIATPIGAPINIVPTDGIANPKPANPPSPKPFTITLGELEARLKKLKEDDMSASPSETDKKLQLVYDISGLLAQHINIINNISNKTPQLNYADNLFLNMLNNSLTNINTTNNQKLNNFNIMVPRKPDMELINIRLKNVTMDNLEDLKQLLVEFNAKSTDSDEQTKTLVNIYDISVKIPFIFRRDGRKTLPIPVIITPQSDNNINIPTDGDEISQLKRQLIDIINTNIPQLQQLSIELTQKNMELQLILSEYSIDNDVINTGYAISKSLDGYVKTVTDEMTSEEMLKQQINDINMTKEILNEKIQDNTDIINKFKATIVSSMDDANKIISQLMVAKTTPTSPQTSPDSSTSSLSYSTTTNNTVGDSSLLGEKFINPNEYAAEIRGLRTRINELKKALPNPSYGSNISKILDEILNMLNEISSNEKTLLTTVANKNYMSNSLIEISNIIELIKFCKVSNKPGYCNTINDIPPNKPDTNENVTTNNIDTILPDLNNYLKQIFTNIVSKVKDDAQNYIDTLNKIIGEDNSLIKSNQIKEVMEKIITFMTGGILKDISQFDNNVLPNYDFFIELIGKIGTLLNTLSSFYDDPQYKSDVNDIQFYLLKTVINMLNCMFINDSNKSSCAVASNISPDGQIQSQLNDIDEIVRKYDVSNIESGDDIDNLRNDLVNLFPGVNVPKLQDETPFMFNQDIEDEDENQSLGNSTLNKDDTIPSRMSDISSSQISDLTNSNYSTNTTENPLGINDSMGSLSSQGTNTLTDTTKNVKNDIELTTESNNIDENNLDNLKKQIGETINKFSDLNNKLNSNNSALNTNKYIFWDKTNNTPTFKVTSTTSQIIDKSTKNNNHFVTLLELLRDSITDASLSKENTITGILSKINNLIDTTDTRFDYKDYEEKLIPLYTELRNLMTNTLSINITNVSKYPQKLSGGGMNDKIRFTYKRKRGTKRAKKSKPTRRRKYTPHKKNYYY
jgi:hypothetical protein